MRYYPLYFGNVGRDATPYRRSAAAGNVVCVFADSEVSMWCILIDGWIRDVLKDYPSDEALERWPNADIYFMDDEEEEDAGIDRQRETGRCISCGEPVLMCVCE